MNHDLMVMSYITNGSGYADGRRELIMGNVKPPSEAAFYLHKTKSVFHFIGIHDNCFRSSAFNTERGRLGLNTKEQFWKLKAAKENES